MSRGSLPPRWKNCPAYGNAISDIFIPFKVPLADSFKSQMQPNCQFTPDMFIKTMKSKKDNIGLWVDLTYTNRFYDKEVVESEGIGYVKLKCRGHQQCPSDEQVDTFIAICKRFLIKNPKQKIAVHCTHGFNRTGFLICSYLVREFDWDIEAAIIQFAKARPPGIYKQDYIDELFKKFDSIDNRTIAPERPGWCNEDDDNSDDEGGSSNFASTSGNNVGASTSSTTNQSNNPFGIEGITFVNDNEKLAPFRKMCTEMCKYRRNGFPGSQPVSLTTENISMMMEEEYMVSWKADGDRLMLLIAGPNDMYFFDRDFRAFQLNNVTFLQKNTNEPLTNTLLDGELVNDLVNGVSCPRYLIYDIVCIEGSDVTMENFRNRLTIIFKQVIGPREAAKKSGLIDRSKEPIGIRIKDFCDLKDTHKYFSVKFQKVLSHEIDGLIFQPVNMPYIAGRCDRVLKWKPPSHNSVDFRLIIKKEDRPGWVEDYVGQLYVNGLDTPFSTIKVTKTLKNYNNKIIECRFDMEKRCWQFMRERTDKSFPNSLTTANGVCKSIRNPITRDYLLVWIHKYRFGVHPS